MAIADGASGTFSNLIFRRAKAESVLLTDLPYSSTKHVLPSYPTQPQEKSHTGPG